MHCDWLQKVTSYEAMCQGLRETACKETFSKSEISQMSHTSLTSCYPLALFVVCCAGHGAIYMTS